MLCCWVWSLSSLCRHHLCWVVGIKLVVLYCSERRPSAVCGHPLVGADFLFGARFDVLTLSLDTGHFLSALSSLLLLSGRSVSSACAAHHFQACCRIYFILIVTALKWQTVINFDFIARLSWKERESERGRSFKGCFIVHKLLGTLWKIATASLKEEKKRKSLTQRFR